MHVAHPTFNVPIWFEHLSPEPEKARSFYGVLFGWSFAVGGPEMGGYALAQKDGRPAAGVGAQWADDTGRPRWSIYFGVADIEAAIVQVRALGGTAEGPIDVMELGRSAYVVDPTGGRCALWEPKKHIGAEVRGEPGAMAWCEVNTRDADQAAAFYAALLGATAKPLPGMDYRTLEHGAEAFAGVLQMDEHWPAAIAPHWMAYFAVADVDAALQLVQASGGKVCVPAFDTPHGRMAVVDDAVGATFSLIQRKAA